MRVLFIPDIHAPVTHPGGFDFIDAVAQKKQPDIVVFIGDVVDHHGISNWVKHPNAPGPKDEYELSLECVQQWYQAYPDAIVTIGNHDNRPMRQAASVGVPGAYLKDYETVWRTPRWKWCEEVTLFEDDEHKRVYVTHAGGGGMSPAATMAKDMTMSVVVGHTHHAGGYRVFTNPSKRWFGLDTGAIIDDRLYAFAYGKPCKKKSVAGCGFYDTEDPMETGFIAMPSGKGEKFCRDNYPLHPMLKGRLA